MGVRQGREGGQIQGATPDPLAQAVQPFRLARGHTTRAQVRKRGLRQARRREVPDPADKPPPDGGCRRVGNLLRDQAVDQRREQFRPHRALDPADPGDSLAQGRVARLQVGDFDGAILN